MPLRLRELIKRVGRLGITHEGGGSKHPHRFRKPGHRVYTVTAHNGLKTDIPDIYIKAMCREFGLDLADVMDAKRNKAVKK